MTRLTLVAAFALLAAGRQKAGPQIATLSGRVTLDGKPVTAGRPVHGGRRPDRPGEGGGGHRGTPHDPAAEPGSAQAAPRNNPRFVAVPAKYEKYDTAGLAVVVARGQTTTYDIELTAR